MSLIHDTLTAYAARLDAIEAQLEALKRRFDLQAKGAIAVLDKPNIDTALEDAIREFITRYWQTHSRPIPLGALARSFGKSSKRLGGIRPVLKKLVAEFSELVTIRGAVFVFPRAEFEAMSELERESYVHYGLSEAERKSFSHGESQRAKARAMPSFDEANADALRAFDKLIESGDDK